MEEFGDLPGLGEGQGAETGIDAVQEKFGRQRVGARVRVQKEKMPARAGRPALGDRLERKAEQLLGKGLGIGDRGGTGYDLGAGSVEFAHPFQPAEDLGEVGAENPPIGMEFIDHHKAEIAEEHLPLGVEGKKAQMDHVRVGNDDRGKGLPDFFPPVAGGVPVIDLGLERKAGLERGDELAEGFELVLLQGLQGKEVKRFGIRIGEQILHHGKVVGQRLPAGRGSGDDHVLSLPNLLYGFRLMGIEPADPHFFQGPGHWRGKVSFRAGKVGLLRGKRLVVDDLRGVIPVAF